MRVFPPTKPLPNRIHARTNLFSPKPPIPPFSGLFCIVLRARHRLRKRLQAARC